MMRDAILNFAKQFSFEPKIENADKLGKYDHFVIAGMGGSHLAADVVLQIRPDLPIKIHSDYGVPPRFKAEALVIASSYSGNTEETIDAYHEAKKRGHSLAVVAVGGKLIELAKQDGVPYIQLLDTGIQPRSALGFSLMSLLALISDETNLKLAHSLADELKPEDYEEAGKDFATKLQGFVPVIYSSSQNRALAYNWKIKFNETGKVPAFYNVFPELNHNEMTGFDWQPATRDLSKKFFFIFLKDDDDRSQIQKRMEVLEKLLKDRGFPVEVVQMYDENPLRKIFGSLLLADWTAMYLAEIYGIEPEKVPMVEEFKKLI